MWHMTHSPTDVELCHRTLIAFNRGMTTWASRGSLDEGAGVVLCAGGTWIPMVANTAFRLEATVPPEELVERADRFFGDMSRGFTVPVRDNGEDEDLRQACVAAGLELFGSETPDLVCTAPLPAVAAPAGVVVRAIADEDDVHAITGVLAAAYSTYGMPDAVLASLFDQPAAVLADPALHVVLASRDDEPIATAMVYESDGAASVQWVGTVPGARRSGLGALVTIVVTNLAFDRGATSVSLQASPMGAPVYLGLGYEKMHSHFEYVRLPKQEG
jgi:hypothetical protein